MKQLNSRITFFHKRVFPVLWFGIMVVVFGGMLTVNFLKKGAEPLPWPIFLMPLVMLGIGYIVMRVLIFPLADEVYDGTDFLLVRKDGLEERISFGQIRNVSYQNLTNPARVVLSLREDTKVGREISFIPLIRYGEFFRGKNPLVEDLIERVDQARRVG